MFKKLLTVGALSAALIGGIGTALAAQEFRCQDRDVRYKTSDSKGAIYERYVIHPTNRFANKFVDGGITWFYKRGDGECKLSNGEKAYQAYYEGRKY
ncbi:LCI fold-containing protein [Xenorhabdus cabanillasii]|uniref:LCI fold domain-containing protein n=1 Tax=Xenorhabdus cabanillasii JM26 TaxID=1427517 RepID=W1J6R5_9GAMM|nr:LCI fold-containing protein [Xenorhabdus cabanillasii]PHM75298.1 hypothetical protein Xcab_04232 [Xenorhabdus cabanillasii JM26]CDL86394.1 conserved exported hypothetical protein [Xenorhabdus cabanillasii JM26]